jgi:hypothetical protein
MPHGSLIGLLGPPTLRPPVRRRLSDRHLSSRGITESHSRAGDGSNGSGETDQVEVSFKVESPASSSARRSRCGPPEGVRWAGGNFYREPMRLEPGEVPADLLARLPRSPQKSPHLQIVQKEEAPRTVAIPGASSGSGGAMRVRDSRPGPMHRLAGRGSDRGDRGVGTSPVEPSPARRRRGRA